MKLPLIVVILLSVSINAVSQVGHWRLENDANDISGNGNNGTSVGGTYSSTDKKQGSYSYYTNGSQYINLGVPQNFPTGNTARTICAWAKTENTTGNRVIAAFGTNVNSQAMFIGQNGNTLVGGAWSNNLTQSSFWTAGVWRHICLTYDGTTARLYADGTLLVSQAKTWNLSLVRAFIGRNVNNADNWQGFIDDVRVYNRSLSEEEIRAIVAAGTSPAAPTNLTAEAFSNTEIDLLWVDHSSNETGFQLEMSTNAAGPFNLIQTLPANTTAFRSSGLVPNSTYYYRIRAVSQNASPSAYSNVASSTTLNLQPPPSPTNVSATALSSSSIRLTWTEDMQQTLAIEVERSTANANAFEVIKTVETEESTFVDTELSAGVVYYYRLRARNSSAYSPYSSIASARTLEVPASPTNLVANAISANAISLSWIDNSNNETGFTIARSTQAGTGYVTIKTLPPNTTSYSDEGLAFGTTYFYKVRSEIQTSFSNFSNEATATTLNSGPNAPTNLTAQGTSSTSITLTWTDDSQDETGFQIERSSSLNGPFSLLSTTKENIDTYRDVVATGTTYFYRIRAVNSSGVSQYSEVVTASSLIAIPNSPSGLTLSPVSTSIIRVSWKDNSSDENEFEIERSLNYGSGYSLVSTVPANTTTFDDENLTSGQTYYYRIRAVNTGGASNYTAEISIRLKLEGASETCESIYCADNGSIGIATNRIPEGFKLAVNGKLMAEGVKVALKNNWPDYVFGEDYKLLPLKMLKKFIDENGHLPNVPPARVVETDGLDMERINVILLEKVEELSLYLIQMEERIQMLEKENRNLKQKKN